MLQADAAAHRVVLFDFDGVLLRGDAFAEFVRARFKRARWRLGLGLLLALPLLPSLLLTRRWVERALIFAVLVGVSEPRYRALAREFGIELARQPGRFHRAALTRLRQHLAEGDRVIVVTGCEDHLVRSLFRELGLADQPLLGSRLTPGRLGMRVTLHNVGVRKVESLRTLGVVPPWDVAYGDSDFDLPMLRESREVVLVNASPAWCKRVERILGRSVTRVDWH